MTNHYFTSESVTEGHPDKICDQISDAILDDLIRQDNTSRVAVECLTTTGLIMVAGEVTTEGFADIQRIARNTLKQIGYTDPSFGIDYQDACVLTAIHEQSPDIALGVDTKTNNSGEQGAGDQGIMFGFACDETSEMMPLPIMLAHKLAIRLAEVRKKGIIGWLGPDGKVQVTVEYNDDIPLRIESVVVSCQHKKNTDISIIRNEVISNVIMPILKGMVDTNTVYHINPTGSFVIGGPEGDTGLTGRKIIIDTYGGYSRHGGGAFSGKDPSKVDRSAAYAARHAAKNIVAAGLARKCELQLSYAIGVSKPVSLRIDTFGTGTVDDKIILEAVRKTFDFSPAGIIKNLRLLRPIYQKTACYGHFGRNDDDFSWEKTDMVDILKQNIG